MRWARFVDGRISVALEKHDAMWRVVILPGRSITEAFEQRMGNSRCPISCCPKSLADDKPCSVSTDSTRQFADGFFGSGKRSCIAM